MEDNSPNITVVLQAISKGDHQATNRLMPMVYEQLRELAGNFMKQQAASHTLHPTALVNEAYVKLCGKDDVDWRSRSHFFAAGAQAMRRILVDHARSKKRNKRGGEFTRVEFNEGLLETEQNNEDILALNDALEKLSLLDDRQAKIVELRFFGGLTTQEVAEALNLSKRTIELEWNMTRAWLRRELSGRSD